MTNSTLTVFTGNISSFDSNYKRRIYFLSTGKTMENVRLRNANYKLVRNVKKAVKMASKPTFESFKIINDDLALVKMKKPVIVLDKPSYVGLCILDLSKLQMYGFHYDVIRAQYGDRARLLFTDTDSLVYDITTPDLYADMLPNIDRHYDTSDYPVEHPLHSKKNAKVVGLFKDELNGVPIVEFVGLRAKMYSFLLPDGSSKQTAKGIKKAHMKKHVIHEHYRDCLLDEKTTSARFWTIRSFAHQITTYETNKTALSPFDDKRYLLGRDGRTLAYGHYKIACK